MTIRLTTQNTLGFLAGVGIGALLSFAIDKLKSITEMKLTQNTDGTITYTRQVVNRTWDEKMYLFPIPQTEIMKNPNLTQNAGW